MSKKILMHVVVSIVILFITGNFLNSSPSIYKPMKIEIALMLGRSGPQGGRYSKELSGMLIAGINFNIIAFEGSAAKLSIETVFSGNFVLNIPIIKQVVPFLTVGLGTASYTYWNGGIGIKIKFSEKLALRAETRGWYAGGDIDISSYFIGVSYIF